MQKICHIYFPVRYYIILNKYIIKNVFYYNAMPPEENNNNNNIINENEKSIQNFYICPKNYSGYTIKGFTLFALFTNKVLSGLL